MLKIVRQEKILALLKDNGSVNLTDLSKQFSDTSRSTLRRDLIELSQHQPISITHGGAVLKEDKQPKATDLSRFDIYGQKAIECIKDRDIIFIDAGRTTHSIANALVNSDLQQLTIVTTTPAVIETLSTKQNSNWNIIVLGGEYRGMMRSVVGPLAEAAASKLHVNKLFIGCTSLDEKGFYTNYLSEVSLRNIEISSASQVILLMNSKKFDKSLGYLVNTLDKISTIITDSIPEDKKAIIERNKISVMLTEKN